MSRANSDYSFVTTSATEIETTVKDMYYTITGRNPTGVDLLFCQWVASAVMFLNENINAAANQNLASRAAGDNLDAIGEEIYLLSRPEAQAAGVQMQFTTSMELEAAYIIPAGTRVTTEDGSVIFTTDEDVVIEAGSDTASVHCTCTETGTVGNGLAIGTINACVDVFPYYESCENTDESAGGSDAATDDEYYSIMIASQDGFSSAGPTGAYEYFAKSVSTDIADVLVNSPSPGQVNLYVLMDDGTPAGDEIKNQVAAACSADERRPATDYVVVDDPEEVTFNIDLTYYLSSDSDMSVSDMQSAVTAAANEYVAWQMGKFGRDINPSKLEQYIMNAGVKRVEITSPTYTALRDGTASQIPADMVPQIGQIGTITLTYGGIERE